MKLHKLSNGTWLDLSTVKAIIALPNSSDSLCGTHRARVRIDHGAHGMELITCNDDEDAVRLSDELAGLVNATNPATRTEA